MAVNKVELSDGTTLVDLSGDTVEPDAMEEGVTAHDASGNQIVGTLRISARVDQTEDGAVITISDKNGTTSATVLNGKTPERGVDYWTAEDVAAMVQAAVEGVLEVVAPSKIEFEEGRLYAPATNVLYNPLSISAHSITFQYRGGSGVEELYFPITGLFPGRTYTISFDETYNGGFIQDTYRYGCGIIQKSEYDSMAKPTTQAKPSWVVWHTGSTGKQLGSITFTANADTVYWAWSLGRLSDGVNVTITMNARVF